MIVKKIRYEQFGSAKQFAVYVCGWYLFGFIPLYVIKDETK